MHDAQRRVERTTTVESIALVLFALALLATAVVVVGQALVRVVRAGAGDVPALWSMGMPLSALLAGLAVPGLAVAMLGAAGALGVAVVVSPSVPIGMARTYDLHSGVKIDLPVLVVGAAGLAVFVAVVTVTAALRAVRPPTGPASARQPGPALLDRLSLPVPVRLGVAFALGRRPGAEPVSMRPALVGAVVGVLMVAGAWTLRAGIDDAIAHPERGGQTWDLQFEPGLAEGMITGDPDVAAASELYRNVVRLNGQLVGAYATRPIGVPVDPVVLSGRLPAGPDEIAIGPATAARFGLQLGDRASAGRDGRRVQVVGTLFLLEYGGHNAYDEGLLATPAGLQALGPTGSGLTFVLIDVRPGADPAAVEERLERAGGVAKSWLPPAGVDVLQRIQTLPLLLGGLVAVLGLATVGHALVTATRRRRGELAVLRALGLSGAQVRAVVLWQASTLAGRVCDLGGEHEPGGALDHRARDAPEPVLVVDHQDADVGRVGACD